MLSASLNIKGPIELFIVPASAPRRVILYAPSHRQDITYHGLCYTSYGALAGMRNSYGYMASVMC